MFASQLTQTIAHDLYTAGNNAGKGYAVGDDEDTVSDAAHNLGEIIIRPGSTSEVYVVRAYEDDRIVAIGGDGMGCGPWAVDLDLDSVEA
jgi:hypothetical protein